MKGCSVVAEESKPGGSPVFSEDINSRRNPSRQARTCALPQVRAIRYSISPGYVLVRLLDYSYMDELSLAQT